MHLLNPAVRRAAVDGPGTEVAYVTVVAVDHLDQRPVLALVLEAQTIAPATKADRPPLIAWLRRIDDETVTSRHAQALGAAAV